MRKAHANILMASLVSGLLAAGSTWAEPIKPTTDDTTQTTDDTHTDTPKDEEPPPDTETQEDPGAGIIDLTNQFPTDENPDDVIYYTLGSPPEGGEEPTDEDIISLSSQNELYQTPEPGSLALGGLGLLGLLGFGWRRKL